MKELTAVAKNILIALMIVVIVGWIGTLQVNANPGNQPAYQVIKPVAVIQVNPLNFSQDYGAGDDENIDSNRQQSMEVKWHNNNQNPEEDQEDLKFKLTDNLTLTNNSSNSKAHGFVNRNNNPSNIIPPEKILISRDGQVYQPLDEWRKVLDKNENSQELSFKINENWVTNNWRDITAGVYKADIDTNISRQGSQPRLVVKIDSAATIKIPEDKSINLTIENPTEAKSSDSVSWQVSGNGGNYQVKFESRGIEPDDSDSDLSIEYSSFFRYSISDDSDNDFAPGESTTVSTNSGELKLNYSPAEYGGQKTWYELLAGKYNDVVTVTVSAD